MNKVGFPLGIKCIVKVHKNMPAKNNPFNFEEDYKRFRTLFNFKINSSREKKDKKDKDKTKTKTKTKTKKNK